jgi:hypothetical protein
VTTPIVTNFVVVIVAAFYSHRCSVLRPSSHAALSWIALVRESAGVGDGVEGLAEVVGDRVGDGVNMAAGLDLVR